MWAAHSAYISAASTMESIKEVIRHIPMTSGNLARNLAPLKKNAHGPWSLFSALVLMPEQDSARAIYKVLEAHSIQVYSAANMVEATQLMRSGLDLVIVDSDLSWLDQLACLAPSTRWRGVTMAIVGQGRNRVLGKRIHFTMPKPLNAGVLASSLKAAYTTLAHQRIANYRHTVPARVVSGTLLHRGWQRTLHHVTVVNLSQTGLCLSAPEPLPHGASLKMNLVLPESSAAVHASGSIVWSHSNGRTGVAFDCSGCPEMKKLQEQLNAWLPPELEVIARAS
jgi:PilZ domain